MRLIHLLLISIATLFFIGIAQAENAKIISPDSLQWRDLARYPGVKMAVLMGDPDSRGPYAIRLKIPANYTLQSYSSDSEEMDTILSGILYFGNGDQFNKQQTNALKAGTFIMIPANAAHYAWTKQETIIQIGGRGPWRMNPVQK